MKLATEFIAYDVYRADCTRAGFVDKYNPTWSGLSSGFRMEYGQHELYLEFGELRRIEHNLPDSITSLDGLACEFRIHMGGAKTTRSGYQYASSTLIPAICDRRIDADKPITYSNLPDRKYSIFVDKSGFDYIRINNDVYTDEYGFNSSSISWVMTYSNRRYSPLELVDSLRTAICIKYNFSYDGSGVYMWANGSYNPYVEVVYGIVKPETTNFASGYVGYRNPYKPVELTWNYYLNNEKLKINGVEFLDRWIVGESCPQKNSVLSIKANDAESYTELTIDGDENSYTVPQNVLDSGGFKWKVGVTSVHDAFSGYSNEKTITTVDSIPSTVIVAPKNTYVNASEAAVFEWQHVISTGSPQNKYELQALVGGEWQTLEEKETALTSAVIPSEQLSSTITAWRVRTANNDGVYGEFSDPASVVLIVAPHVSGVAVTGNVLPVVSWQSDDQQGYEVMVDDVSTGVHYGTQKTYAWQELLADGAHTVKVRAVNRFGLFSEWVSVTHTVANAGLETAPVLTAVAADGLDVELRWTGAGYSAVRIYRDGALLDNLTGYATQYTDHTATGRHVYSVRVSDASGNYADSAPAVADPQILDAAIAVEGVWDWVRLIYAPGADAPQRSVSLAPVYALNYYSGRAYPAVEMSAHRSATYSVSYALDDAGDAERLRGMLGRVVVHKRRDELLRGLLQSVSEVRTCWGEEVTLSIVEVSDD